MKCILILKGIFISVSLVLERGERFPSGHILRKLARPLGLDESLLLATAGYLFPDSETGESVIKDFFFRLNSLPPFPTVIKPRQGFQQFLALSPLTLKGFLHGFQHPFVASLGVVPYLANSL